jgi:hypothetical protein
MKNLIKSLSAIQSELKAPKSQYNSFGKYKYRNCEDIMEAVKPLLSKHGMSMVITDQIIEKEGRFYVEAEVILFDKDGESLSVTAWAREEENKKGMDGSQVTGASSSYARKYALNGMFLIDDTKDADTTQGSDNATSQKAASKPIRKNKTTPITQAKDENIMDKAVQYVKSSTNKTTAYNQIIKKYGDQLTDKQKEGLKKFVG